jgi:regulator of cell morphogenesis and NO signaling
MLILGEMKLADVIHHDYNLVPVISRFDISLGFGDGTIKEICDQRNVNLEFFLSILNTFHDEQYFPKDYLKSFPASLIINYLRKAHSYYSDEKIPEIKSLIRKLVQLSNKNNKTLKLISNFFDDYCNEFASHLLREETIVYPYVLKLEKALEGKSNNETIDTGLLEYSITTYEADHEDVEEKLFDMKSLIIKYLPLESNNNKVFEEISYSLLRELFVLEKELNEHSRIEDMILVPKVEGMEKHYKSDK